MFTDSNGFTGRHEVTFEIDKEAGPGPKWILAKKKLSDKDKQGPSGKPPPNRSKEKGIELRERSNPPTKTTSYEGEDKKIATEVHNEDSDSDSDSDLSDHTSQKIAQQMGVPVSLLTSGTWLPSGFGSPSQPPISLPPVLTIEIISPAVFTAADTTEHILTPDLEGPHSSPLSITLPTLLTLPPQTHHIILFWLPPPPSPEHSGPF